MAGPSEVQTNGKSPAVHTKREPPRQVLPQHLIRDPYYVIPHVDTYSGLMNASNQSYYIWSDQAQRDSLQNTLAMKRDGFIYELLRHRQLPVVGLPHHIAVDDPEDPDQKSIADVLSAIVSDIPRLGNLKLTLSEAIFYGKMGVQTRIGPRRVMGNTWNSIDSHISVNGDKLRFRWDGTPGIVIRSGSENADQPAYSENSVLHRYKDYVEQTMLGPALFLTSPFLRDRFVLHFFEPSDSDYLFEIEESQSIFGLGLRSRFYWLWTMRIELLSWMLDALQRVGANGMLYAFYPSGNYQARNSVIDALRQLVKDNISAFPIDPTNQNYKDVIQKIDPSQVGYDQMFQLITHLEEIMRRGILGQDLSSKSKPTGIGKGASDLQGDVREDYIIYDANSLYETLDDQLLKVILRYNHFLYRGQRVRGDDLPFSARLKAQVDKRNVQEQIEAAEKLFNMGVDLDKDDVRDIAGFSPPKKRHSALVNPQIKAAMQQFEAGIPGIQRAGSDFKSLVSGITQKAGAAGLMGGNGAGEGSPAPAGMGGGGQGKAARFARAGDADDCGHDLSGEFSQENECAGDGELRDYSEELPLYSDDDVRGEIKRHEESGDKARLAVAKDELRSRMKEKRSWIDRIRDENYASNLEKSKGANSVILRSDEKTGLNQIMVHKSARDPGKWQLTFFSFDGKAAGHEVFDTQEDAIASASGKFVGRRLPHGHSGYKVKEVARNSDGRVKIDRFRRLAGDAELSPRRFVRAGEAGDCGHERRGGEFTRKNTCAGDGRGGSGHDHDLTGEYEYSDGRNSHKVEVSWDYRRKQWRYLQETSGSPLSDSGYLDNDDPVGDLSYRFPEIADELPGGKGDDEEYGHGEGEIPFRMNGISFREYDELCNDVFGHDVDLQDLFRIAGFDVGLESFPGARVCVSGAKLGGRTRVTVDFFSRGLRMSREFQKAKDGRPYLRIELTRVRDPELLGKGGFGRKLFASVVDQSIKGGMAFISNFSAGDAKTVDASTGSEWSGYYVWPRFGYDARVYTLHSEVAAGKLTKILGRDSEDISKKGYKISELMMSPEGREWWQRYGEAGERIFDLAEGSLSRRILSAYLKEKGDDPAEGTDRFRTHRRTDRWQAKNQTQGVTNPPTHDVSTNPQHSPGTTKRPSTGLGSESAGRTRPSRRNTGTTGRRGNLARFSRITIPDDAETISAVQVAALISDQYWNTDRFNSLEGVTDKWISSGQFHLMQIPAWLPSPYRRIEGDDPAYTTGPIVVDLNKHGKLDKYNGAFGQSLEISILDGQHRQRRYLEDGIDEIEAYVGSEAIPIIEGLVRDYAPYREKFKDALERYYTSPGSTTLRGVVESGKTVGLSLDQTDEIFENFRSGIFFDVNTGEFHRGDIPSIV